MDDIFTVAVYVEGTDYMVHQLGFVVVVVVVVVVNMTQVRVILKERTSTVKMAPIRLA